jgi:hypothetical protein
LKIHRAVCAVLGLERERRLTAKRRLQTLAVVDRVDEGADVACGVAAMAIKCAVDLFALACRRAPGYCA